MRDKNLHTSPMHTDEMRHKRIAVLYHIFYEDTILNINDELSGVAELEPYYFFNICAETPGQVSIKAKLCQLFPGSFITVSSNIGKDIGGKLLLLKALLLSRVEVNWILFLHDKKSFQALNALTWKQDLFKIIEPAHIKEVEAIIATHKNCGIVATTNYVRKEGKYGPSFSGNNGALLTQLAIRYNISNTCNEYIAGTIFWAKASCFTDFFRTNDPLEIRQTLEPGNVIDNFSGTLTHSWERMFSWIVTSRQLGIKTI